MLLNSQTRKWLWSLKEMGVVVVNCNNPESTACTVPEIIWQLINAVHKYDNIQIHSEEMTAEHTNLV